MNEISSSYFILNVNEHSEIQALVVNSVNFNTEEYTFAKSKSEITEFTSAEADIDVDINYHSYSNSAKGWLDFILFNVREYLKMSNNQVHFRDIQSVAEGNITRFTISEANSDTKVWDISEPTNPINLQTDFSDNT